MRPNIYYTIPKHVFSQTVDDHTILFNSLLSKRFGLDPMGACFWSLMQSSDNLAQVFNDLSTIFSVPAATLEADVYTFYKQMQQLDLVAEVKRELL